jgi:glycosyltransferase involved in cell wall biosynthesis
VKPRVLIFIVAYNAEKTISGVLSRIPESLQDFDTEVLIIDDSSQDRTFEVAHQRLGEGECPFRCTTLFNAENQGYGGNQKIGFHYAIENGFDVVALVHGDGQYAPEELPNLLRPVISGEADAVFGSRMLVWGGAISGGMPLYKFVGNKILTAFQNAVLGTALSEFHSGYRVYAVPMLNAIPFDLNTNVFHFDTEIIIQTVFGGYRIKELPIPTYYGDEICHVDGFRYAFDVVKTTLLARAQHLGLFYRRNLDVQPTEHGGIYEAKLGFNSSHTYAIDSVARESRVLDIGCAGGYVGEALVAKGCSLTGVDRSADAKDATFQEFIQLDLDSEELDFDPASYDTVLMLDVIEHLSEPERFMAAFAKRARQKPDLKIIVTTGNVGFIIIRLSMLFGMFNYGKRGILDLTHKRLFTFATLRSLFEQFGFEVLETRGIPAPFPLAFGNNVLGRFLVLLNNALIRVSKTLFGYQVFMVARPRPSLDYLLTAAYEESERRQKESLTLKSDKKAS